jgi:hypothetical protein
MLHQRAVPAEAIARDEGFVIPPSGGMLHQRAVPAEAGTTNTAIPAEAGTTNAAIPAEAGTTNAAHQKPFEQPESVEPVLAAPHDQQLTPPREALSSDEPTIRDSARYHSLLPRRERAPKLTINRLDIQIINQNGQNGQNGQTPAPFAQPAPRASAAALEAREVLDRHLLGRFDLS